MTRRPPQDPPVATPAAYAGAAAAAVPGMWTLGYWEDPRVFGQECTSLGAAHMEACGAGVGWHLGPSLSLVP